jgi:hypothetical protein
MTLGSDGHDREPLDLSPLDPTADSESLERIVRRIHAAAASELLRRRSGPALIDLIVRWRRPILAASLLLAVASGAVLMTVRQPVLKDETTLAESLGVPRVWAGWIDVDDRPAPGELLKADGSEP